MAQVSHFSLQKCTFLKLRLKTLLLQPPQHHLQPLQMLLYGGGEDHNVIELRQQRLTLLVTEQPLHQSLEGARGVAEAEWHTIPFEQAKRSTKCGFGSVGL